MLLAQQDDMEVISEAADGREAIQQSLSLKPDVIIMDLSMPPGKNGLEATTELKQSLPDSNIIILTMHDDDKYLFQVLQAGASGYILKNALDSELVNAIRSVSNGQVYLYPTATKKLVENYLVQIDKGEDMPKYNLLSDREKETLVLIAKGYSNKEISEILYISVKTVESHKSKIMDKLGFQKRHELVQYAMKKGLLDLDV
ncbi:response regulator [Ornithinibacillus sp. L9]|uniref:Response regulator n=2 Tax=Ornithinibacillus caprae TaxID=2678566 RepID=A0A6N8FHE6_9BACI|nr:response regulator [Ornithinibacillus caprae]